MGGLPRTYQCFICHRRRSVKVMVHVGKHSWCDEVASCLAELAKRKPGSK